MIHTEYSSCLNSRALVYLLRFFLFHHAKAWLDVRYWQVGLAASMFFLFSEPSTVSRSQYLIRICCGSGFLCGMCITGPVTSAIEFHCISNKLPPSRSDNVDYVDVSQVSPAAGPKSGQFKLYGFLSLNFGLWERFLTAITR